MQRQLFAATKALLLAAMCVHLQAAAALDNSVGAADTAKPRAVGPGPVRRDKLVAKALQAMGGAEEIVFVVRDLCSAYQWYATFGEYADEAKYIHAPDGSQLAKLNLRTRQVRVLLDDPKGGFRDPRVDYDGGKILFAYRPGGTHHYHLCEINADGSGFRQLTFGDCDDVDPAYLPDGGIVFASSRCNRFVACNRAPAAILYRMDADGGNIRCLSANTISEDRPAVLPDGRILYTRWDYTDRDPEKFRDLWVMNPDGTGQMVLFGGVGRPYPAFFAKCDALPVPGTDGTIVSVFSPAFGRRENAGNVMLVDVKAGPGALSAARQISPEAPGLGWSIGSGQGREGFRDPYPLSTGLFLVAQDKSLLVLDDAGKTEEFYRAEKMVHDPRVIRPRLREPVLPTRVDLQKTTGQLVLTDVYRGRNMAGVRRGTIQKLLVLEDLPKPGSKHGLPGYHGGYITLRRVLGTVPVEADGSASFEVPALRGVYFVALDAKGVAVKRMQNFTTVMPGETQGCVGCHEPRTGSPDQRVDSGGLMALKRPPDRIAPLDGVPDVFDYPRDIQPIWDRHCVACHNSEKPEGRVVLTGDNTEWFTQSYAALLAYDQVSQCCSWGEDGNHPPYGFGTGASPLVRKLDGSHYEAKLTQREYDTVRLWIETGAGFTGTYAVFNHPENAVATPLVVSKPELGNPVAPIARRRCLTCHGSVAHLGRRSKQQRDDQWSNGKPPTLLNYPLYCWSLYNLSSPEKSMILRASLSKEAGGYEWCRAQDGRPAAAFRDANDPDYQAILQAIRAAKTRQEQYGRPDIRGFRPGDYYVRWMKRFGVLPERFDLATDPIDPYQTDRAYWRSLWYQPPAVSAASAAGPGRPDKATGNENHHKKTLNPQAPFALWDPGVPFPTRGRLAFPAGATHGMVHRAGADGYHFLHDSAVVEHKGNLFAAWYNCPRGEMVGESLIRGRRSQDGGRTWSDVETLAGDAGKQGILYVPVAFLSHGGKLYAFVTNMKGGPDLVHHCEVFLLDERTNTWISRGFITGPFLPNCAPQRLADGNFVMAGRMADQPGQKPTIPAVAISQGEDVEKPWSLVQLLPTGKLDDGRRIPCPETTVLVEGRELTALVRRDGANSLVFVSRDNGRTWSAPCEHNFPMASSKIYAGVLSTGQRYLLCNLPTGGYRDLLVIAVTRPGQKAFVKMWKLRDGHDTALKAGPEWSYPCAIEADGKLHVVYTSEKRHCVLTTVPLESLATEPTVPATAVQAPPGGGPSTEAIPRAVGREIDAGLFPGAVVLIGRPARVLYHEAFGHARIVPRKVPMQKDSIFDLASVTNVVATATAFGICADEGSLGFGMPIGRALPGLSGSGIGPITVDQLATHTSGFDNTKYHGGARGEAMLEQMLRASPRWKPGSRYYYSCLNMILLGRMVEKASGQRLAAFCQSRIFGPLAMRDTAFGPLPPGPRVVPSGAPEVGQIEDEQARLAGRPVGNAGLFSTAGDLARFCDMMLDGGRLDGVRILSAESHRRMTRNQLGPSLPPRGFGWDMDPQALHRPRRLSNQAYGHSGRTGQSIWIDPEKQVYVIVLTNRNHPQMVGGQRKTQQYQARARIGDAALEFLASQGRLPKDVP